MAKLNVEDDLVFEASEVSVSAAPALPAGGIRLEDDLVLLPDRPWDASPALKRGLDIVVSLIALVVLAPLLVVLAVLVAATSPGGAFFVQRRVGRNGTYFPCVKLRTMHASSEQRLADVLARDDALRTEWEQCQKLTLDPRVTRLGRLLRLSNLDELPQLWNVLCGQMSLIGPRPVVPLETVRYGAHLDEVLSVRPGLSGLWQTSGRNNLSYDERVRLDLVYVRTRTMRVDLKIALRTLVVTVQGSRSGAR
ncbi:MAG: sugar transferase [Acidimicrobiales bacterium]